MKVIEYINTDTYREKHIHNGVNQLWIDSYFNELDNQADIGMLEYTKSKYYVENGVNCILVDIYL